MKKIRNILFGVVILLVIVAGMAIRKFNGAFFREKPNYLAYTFEPTPIHFEWTGRNIDGHRETQAAMIIPVRIPGLPHRFYVQFDTGSPYTFIYGNTLDSLRGLGLEIKEIAKDKSTYVERLDFRLDSNLIEASMVSILPDYGRTFDRQDTTSWIGIGTIGSDFLTNRITVLDFNKQSISLFEERPDWMADLPAFMPFDFRGRRIMLPASIDGKTYELLYDSGCSAFGLITTKKRFKRYTKKEEPEIKYGAKSWSNGIPIASKPSDKSFQVGGRSLSMKRVSYIDKLTWLQPLVTPFTSVGGWLGNQPFNEATLIIDTKKEAFTVISSASFVP